MSAPAVHLSRPAPGVALLTIDNPDKLGAINTDMRTQLSAGWQTIRADTSFRAVVLTGTGRGFCTGLDLAAADAGDEPAAMFGDADELPNLAMSPFDHDVWLPYIVAVNGVCAGGGFHMLTEADIVIAAPQATFVDPHVSIGQVAALEPVSLARRIPLETVLRMVVLGRAGALDAADARRVGLISEIIEPDDLVARAVELASAAAANSPAAIEASKRALWASLEVGLSESRSAAWKILRQHWGHPDYREGIEAFADRRDPVWAPRIGWPGRED